MSRLSVLIPLILGVSAGATVVVQTDKKVITARPDGSAVHLLYIADAAGLLQVASSSYGVTADFCEGAEAIAADYHYPRNLLFWATSRGQLFSSALNESRGLGRVCDARLVHEEARWYPQSIAVDQLRDRLYVLDTRSNSLRVASLQAGNATGWTLMSVGRRNYRPRQLELDAEAGYLFLLDQGEPGAGRYAHVLRMGLDGSDPRIIDPPPINLELVTGAMTLDRARARLLLSSRSQRRIVAADYHGKLVDTVLERQNGSLGMSATADELFWINAAYYNKGAEFTDGSVYKCDLERSSGRCRANSTRRLYDSFGTAHVRGVLAVSPPPPGRPEAEACRCAAERSICLAPSTCACHIGYAGGQCSPVERFLLYEDRRVVRSLCPGEARCQAFAPFRAELRLRGGERTGFDYDPLARQLYFGGRNAIYRADLDSGNNASVLLYQRAVFFGPMALDWLSKNLYYTEIEQRGNVSFYLLKVLSARPGADAERSSSMLWELGRVHSLAACPRRGLLFLSVFHNGLRRFQMRRLHADGTNMTVLLGLNDTTFFSIDHRGERLYSVNANTSSIVRSDLQGQRLERLGRPLGDVAGLTGFLVDDQFVYLKYRSRLLKLDKRSGESLGQLDLEPHDTDMSADLRLHGGQTPGLAAQNLCALDNGGCDNFCFATPAPDGRSLSKLCRCFDGVRCFGDTRSGLRLAETIKNAM